MENLNILELLDKEILSPEEKQQLNKLLTEDPEANRFAQIYKNIKDITQKGSHIDNSILSEYILIKNRLENESKWLLKLEPKIEDHLRKCELCNNNFKLLNEEYSDVESFLTENLNHEEQNQLHEKDTKSTWWHLQVQPVLTRFAYLMAALFLVYFSLFSYYNLTTPNYKKSFMVFENNQEFVTRGRVSTEYQKGVAELEENNFDKAIESLNSDIKNNPNDKTIFYTYFILGKTYLKASEKNVFGFYNTFDKEKLEKGINAFNEMIRLNKNSAFYHLNYDAHYFIARALLVLDNIDEAKKHLKIVIENNGSYKKNAENILDTI